VGPDRENIPHHLKAGLSFISFDANPTSEPAPNSLNATDDNATTADGSENATTAAASASSAVGSVGTPVQKIGNGKEADPCVGTNGAPSLPHLFGAFPCVVNFSPVYHNHS
jgi:hypothetical protein